MVFGWPTTVFGCPITVFGWPIIVFGWPIMVFGWPIIKGFRGQVGTSVDGDVVDEPSVKRPPELVSVLPVARIRGTAGLARELHACEAHGKVFAVAAA